jgi:hypothetical protein
MQFSPAFKQLHRTLGRSLSLEQLANIANPAALGLSGKRDFYEPVKFGLTLTTAGDAINIGVPVAENESWLSELKRRVASTLDFPVDGAGLEFRTINEVPLQLLAVQALPSVGHLNVYRNGVLVRLPELPKVPIQFSVTKLAALNAWVKQNVGRDLAESIAKELLVGKDVHEIDAAVASDGAVAKRVRDHFAKGWPTFLQTYHMDSPSDISGAMADQALDRVTRHVLRSIRSFVKASSALIQQQVAARKAQQAMAKIDKKQTEEDVDLFKSVLGPATVATEASGNEGKLFRSLMMDALSAPQLQQLIVSSIYCAPLMASGGAAAAAVMATKPLSSKAQQHQHHPWYRHVHETLLPLRGSYPSDYMVRHTKQDMSISAPYAGDALQTYQRYHLYSGKLPVPPGLVVRGGVPQPIEGHWPHDKKKKRRKSKKDEGIMGEMPPLVPLANKRRLIPISEIIGSPIMPPLKPIQGAMPALVPIHNGHIMPKLVPISCHGNPQGKVEEEEEDKPQGVESEMRSRLIELEDADDESINYAQAHEEILASGPTLPPLDDLFK